MKKLLFIGFILAVILSSCGYYGSGDLVGVSRKQWYTPDPYGMLFVPPGSYNMGPSDQDVPNAMTATAKTVTVQGFWMDETEITNAEYRQFVNWVRDSLALTVLAENPPENYDSEGRDFFLAVDENDPNALVLEAIGYDSYNFDGYRLLDWQARLDYSDPEIKAALIENSNLYLKPPPKVYHFMRRIDLNTNSLYYEYYWVDLKQAAKKHAFRKDGRKVEQDVARTFDREMDAGIRIGRHWNADTEEYEGTIKDREELKKRREWEDFEDRDVVDQFSYIMHERVAVYPDTLCWMSEFTYSYNDPMTEMYFWHPSYDFYPVVGVSWMQAQAFSKWRSMLKNAYQRDTRDFYLNQYRLPTESEWEYAARGGLDLQMYPWGGLYTRNYSGCFIANFKPMRGNYYDDGGVQTLMVGTYDPNEYGLYDMAGNVAEWTNNAFEESAYRYTHDLNPNYEYYAHPDDPPVMKRKVIRGGSWKDVAFYMQNGTRTYEYQDSAKSHIGFRNVRTYLGRHRADGVSYSQVY
jgi:formylglycine-generating enzyme required for sulfatase activity